MKKSALVVGINQYHKLIGPLRGPINDATAVVELLRTQYHFSLDRVKLLCDNEATHAAIMSHLERMIAEATQGDVIMFYFSGHGTRLPNRQDPSGKDEAIVVHNINADQLLWGRKDLVPIFARENWGDQFVRDKELAAQFSRTREGVNLTIVFDCCHSGDMYRIENEDPRFVEPPKIVLDQIRESCLAFHVRDSIEEASTEVTKFDLQKYRDRLAPVFGGNRFEFTPNPSQFTFFAACREDQTAIERNFGGEPGGVFTHFLVTTLRANPMDITHREAISAITRRMRFQQQTPQLVCPEDFWDHNVLEPLQT